MKKLCAVLFAILVLTAMVQADIYIKSKTHSDAFSIMGQSQPEKNDVAEQWIGDEMFANLTKKVGQWNCTGYEATISMMMMPMKMTIWASTDVPFDLDKYMEKVYGNVLKAQMMMDDAA